MADYTPALDSIKNCEIQFQHQVCSTLVDSLYEEIFYPIDYSSDTEFCDPLKSHLHFCLKEAQSVGFGVHVPYTAAKNIHQHYFWPFLLVEEVAYFKIR